MLHAATSIDGRFLWATLHLLCWCSLTPFASGWMGENPVETPTVALYGVVLLSAGLDYRLLARALIPDRRIAHALKSA